MSIPPISNPFSFPPNPSSELALALKGWMKPYAHLAAVWQNDPTPENLQKLEEFMGRLKQFLTDNEAEIFATAKGQGWTLNGPAGSNYQEFFNTAVLSIDHFLEHPNSGSLDLSFEGLSQLHWLMVSIAPPRPSK